jgi:glucose-1-phosphate thymidylyltransferase
MILGDNIFVGAGLGSTLKNNLGKIGATIFGVNVKNPSDYGVVELNKDGRIVNMFEKPTTYVSSTAIPGLYFLDENSIDMAKALEASDRGELEIIDLLKHYWSRNQLEIQLLPIGTGWLDAGTSESLFMSGEYIRVMQNRHGVSILCPEEIAYRNGWITDSALRNSIPSTISSEYDRYLKALIDE